MVTAAIAAIPAIIILFLIGMAIIVSIGGFGGLAELNKDLSSSYRLRMGRVRRFLDHQQYNQPYACTERYA